jgi:hypothetical protein
MMTKTRYVVLAVAILVRLELKSLSTLVLIFFPGFFAIDKSTLYSELLARGIRARDVSGLSDQAVVARQSRADRWEGVA